MRSVVGVDELCLKTFKERYTSFKYVLICGFCLCRIEDKILLNLYRKKSRGMITLVLSNAKLYLK